MAVLLSQKSKMLSATTIGAATLSRRPRFALDAVRTTTLSRSQPRFIRRPTESACCFQLSKQSDRRYTSQTGTNEEEDGRQAKQRESDVGHVASYTDLTSQSSFPRSRSSKSNENHHLKENEDRENNVPRADHRSRPESGDTGENSGGSGTFEGGNSISDGGMDDGGILDGILGS